MVSGYNVRISPLASTGEKIKNIYIFLNSTRKATENKTKSVFWSSFSATSSEVDTTVLKIIMFDI